MPENLSARLVDKDYMEEEYSGLNTEKEAAEDVLHLAADTAAGTGVRNSAMSHEISHSSS